MFFDCLKTLQDVILAAVVSKFSKTFRILKPHRALRRF